MARQSNRRHSVSSPPGRSARCSDSSSVINSIKASRAERSLGLDAGDQPGIFRDRVRGHGLHREGGRPRVGKRDSYRARHHARDAASRRRRCAKPSIASRGGRAPTMRWTSGLRLLASHVAGRGELARAFVQIQLQAAIGAGQIDAGKRQLLWRVASALGVNRAEVAQLEALVARLSQRGAGANPTQPRTSTKRIACSACRRRRAMGSEDRVSPPDEPVPSGQDRRARLAEVNGRDGGAKDARDGEGARLSMRANSSKAARRGIKNKTTTRDGARLRCVASAARAER